MWKLLTLLALATAALAGCKTPAPIIETQYKIVTVSRVGPCPDDQAYQRLVSSRPVPLRSQAQPADAVARVAQIIAQLGLYEGAGAWADQVQASLDRCQAGAEPERVAPVE